MVDDLDKQIIEELSQNARASSKMLGKKLNVDSSTVRRRIHRMQAEGIIHFTALQTLQKTGFPVKAMIGLEADSHDLNACVQTIAGFPECKIVWVTTGRFNIMIHLWCQTNADIRKLIQKILAESKGIRNVETFVCLETVKSLTPGDVQNDGDAANLRAK